MERLPFLGVFGVSKKVVPDVILEPPKLWEYSLRNPQLWIDFVQARVRRSLQPFARVRRRFSRIGRVLKNIRFWVAQRFQRCDRVSSQSGFLAAEVRFMAAPLRGNTGHSCYFITASTFQKQSLFQTERMANLFLDVLFNYRRQNRYHLHEFVVMPDHFHLLITPTETLERALQLIKGSFSFRAKKELGFGGAIWQKSFYDRRVRDIEEYCAYRDYIHRNPVKKRLVSVAADYPYTSARPGFEIDGFPQRLNPISVGA